MAIETLKEYLVKIGWNVDEISFKNADSVIDGVSGKIVYDKEGNFQYASTRGDGLVGAIIPFANQIKEIPKKFLPNSELRGEFFISKKNRKYFNGPLRNNCSGLLNIMNN